MPLQSQQLRCWRFGSSSFCSSRSLGSRRKTKRPAVRLGRVAAEEFNMEVTTRNVTIGGVLTGAFAIAGIYLDQSGLFEKSAPPVELTVADCPAIPPVSSEAPTIKGYVWIPEDFDFVNGQFVRIAGHWEHKRANPTDYYKGHWELSDGRCEWVRGAFAGESRSVSGTIAVRDHQ